MVCDAQVEFQNIQQNNLEMQAKFRVTETHQHLHGLDTDTFTIARSRLLANCGRPESAEGTEGAGLRGDPTRLDGSDCGLPTNCNLHSANKRMEIPYHAEERRSFQHWLLCRIWRGRSMQLVKYDWKTWAKMISSTSQAVPYERSGMNEQRQASRKHFEAEKQLRRKWREPLQRQRSEVRKNPRSHSATMAKTKIGEDEGTRKTSREKIIQCDLEWKTDGMQYACRGSALDETDLEFTMHGVNNRTPRVQEILVLGSLLSSEADTMSAMRHRMNKAMSPMRADMYFCKNLGILERRKRDCCIRRKHGAAR